MNKSGTRTKAKKRLFAFCIVLTAALFMSCSRDSEPASFLTSLDKVDSFIRTGQTSDAVKLLKKTSRLAFSAYARIGIYKRYITLGEKGLAEKTLVKAIKKIPENEELRALYGTFLLRANRTAEALKQTESLSGTKYGSVYSEAVLKECDRSFENLTSSKMVPVYVDAYNSTQNDKWLVNASLPYLLSGDYSAACAMQQDFNPQTALFWAKVQYDGGNYDLCVQNVEQLDAASLSGDAATLASDAYFMLGDFDSAEKERSKLLALSDLEYNVKIPKILAVNSAIWSYNSKDYTRAYNLLTSIVLKDSDFVPALLTYGKFSVLDSEVREIDTLERELLKTDLRSISMKENDERPRFLIDDAMYRIDGALMRQRADANIPVSDELIVEKLSLFLQSKSDLPFDRRLSEIWNTLEKNEVGTDLYPPLLVNYAIVQLLRFSREQDARNLFQNYLDARYKMNPEAKEQRNKVKYDIFGGEHHYSSPVVPDWVTKAAFGDRAAQYANTMEVWEVEFAAYFAMLDSNLTAARRLYEYALFETGGVKRLQSENTIAAISPLTEISSALNLALIYSSSGENEKAVSLYGLSSGKTRDKKLKSQILYKNAVVQLDMKNTKGAILSLDYAISLDPLNAEARLLRKKMN